MSETVKYLYDCPKCGAKGYEWYEPSNNLACVSFDCNYHPLVPEGTVATVKMGAIDKSVDDAWEKNR